MGLVWLTFYQSINISEFFPSYIAPSQTDTINHLATFLQYKMYVHYIANIPFLSLTKYTFKKFASKIQIMHVWKEQTP